MVEHLPAQVSVGMGLLSASVLLLAQGLIRDLWLISRRNVQTQNTSVHRAMCMCVESTVGVTGVVAGLIVLGGSIDAKIPISHVLVVSVTTAVLIVGFVVKNYVFEFRPFRIRRDQDHLNIVFSSKR